MTLKTEIADPDKKTFRFVIVVKKWGLPILLYKAIKRRKAKKWFMWPVIWLYDYPKLCIKAIWG